MYLVDDIYAVSSYLRRDAYLIHQCLDIIYSIVGCCIHFDDVGNGTGEDPLAGRTSSAGVAVDGRLAVERARQNFCARGLTGTA